MGMMVGIHTSWGPYRLEIQVASIQEHERCVLHSTQKGVTALRQQMLTHRHFPLKNQQVDTVLGPVSM